MKTVFFCAAAAALASLRLLVGPAAAADNTPPPGFVALFNGKDLAGWKTKSEGHWKAEEGVLVYDGKGGDLITAKDYRNFVLYVDWKIGPKGDSGVYLRGEPQVQIWDNPEGSGGLYNDKVKALKKADKPIGEWNRFEIIVEKDVVTVKLNGETVVDRFAKKWKRERGPIHLQHHGNPLWFKNIYLKELPD